MKREGLHYVVVERDEKYMANLTRWCRSSSKKMDVALAEMVLYLGSNGDEASSR